jgi:UDP-N-acetylmuramate dehydrogenase
LPSAGSIFKRPKPDFYVGKAIDDLGLKGYTIGGAMISKIHAGFIVNTGNATFSDVMKLIDFVRNEILKNYNIDLDLEINIWR